MNQLCLSGPNISEIGYWTDDIGRQIIQLFLTGYETKIISSKWVRLKLTITNELSLSGVVPKTKGNQRFLHRQTNWQIDTRKICNRKSQLESAQSVPKDQSWIRSPNLLSFNIEKLLNHWVQNGNRQTNPYKNGKQKNFLKSWVRMKNQIWISCPYQVSRLNYKADSRTENIIYESVVPIRSQHFRERLMN